MTRELQVDFNALPRITRERLIHSTSPTASPAPLFATPSKADSASLIVWAGVGVICGFILFLATDRFGQVDHPVQAAIFLPLYIGALFFLLALGIVLLFQSRWRRPLPFRPGRYLFPSAFIDARSRLLRIIPLSELAELDLVHAPSGGASIQLRFHNSPPEQFRVLSRAQAQAQLTLLQQLRDALAKARARQDTETLRRHDPFFEARAQPGGLESLRGKTSGGSEEGPRVYKPSLWVRKPILVGLSLVLSAGLGQAGFHFRNVWSDDAAFALAQADSGTKSLSTYAARGWHHVDEARELISQRDFQRCEQEDTEPCWKDFVRQWPGSPRQTEAHEERLPRAALKATPRTVAALEAFLERYPNSVVEKEVRELIPATALQELPPNSVAELRRFREKYPRSNVDEYVQDLIRQLYAEARAELQNQASTQNRDFVPFMNKLLAHLEKTERSQVLVHFRHQSSPSLRTAARLLRANSRDYGIEGSAPVSGYFTAGNTDWPEDKFMEALQNAFQQLFPAKMLSLERSEKSPESKQTSVVPDARIDIDYTISWSGTAYSLREFGRQFAGLQFDFQVTLRLAGAKPVSFKLKVKPPKALSVRTYGYGLYAADSTVYDTMAQRAVGELGAKLGKAFFRQESRAFQSLQSSM